MKKIQHRIRRIIGQLESIDEALSNEVSCDQLVPQFLAARGAVNAAVCAYLEDSLEHCVDLQDQEKIKKLISLLIKNS